MALTGGNKGDPFMALTGGNKETRSWH